MMREVRRDPVSGRMVVISTDRPLVVRTSGPDRPDHGPCPFCPGNEGFTAATIARRGAPDAWQARAFANRAPALRVEEPLWRRGLGPYDRTSGTGAHEVVVESPDHAPLHLQPPSRMASALLLARDRMADLARDTRLRHLVWFRNHGRAAGASQVHPHAQILGLPEVPHDAAIRAERVDAHHRRCGRPLLQDVVDTDRAEGERVVWEGDRVAVLSPWAPAVPFALWLVPLAAGPAFRDADDGLVQELAVAMHAALTSLGRELGEPAYNAVLHDTPIGADATVHWPVVRVLPRIAGLGGLEVGVGVAINPMPPEAAARRLRGRRAAPSM